MTTNQSNKELAVALAEKLGKPFEEGEIEYKCEWYCEDWLDSYLEQKAKDILFMEGMAEKIHKYLADCGYCSCDISGWFGALENNGTLTPQKVITVFLELED